MSTQAQIKTTLQEITSEAKNVSAVVQRLTKKVENGELNTAKGVSFLEVKHQLLIDYVLNLTHLMHTKVSGREKIEGSPDIWRMIENRTVLEKMRPIEHKLKYQIDKLVQTATTGALDQNDPLSFKPNPQGLVSKIEESSESTSDDDDDKTESKAKKYVPPKLRAMHYDGDLTQKDKQNLKLEKAKKRALSSSIMQDLRDEYSEAPEEVQDTLLTSRRLKRQLKERSNYEEDHFVRLSMSKQDRTDIRQQQRLHSNLDKLTNFSDISVLDGKTAEYDPTAPKKKKGMKRKAGKGGKSKKGRKRGKFGH